MATNLNTGLNAGINPGLRQSISGGVDSLGLFRSASLDLRFADKKTLTDRVSGNNLITFSRASSGTYVDSDGLIKTSPVNLVTYSEQFDQSSWIAVGIETTVTPNAATAPDGTNSAYLITALADTALNSELIYQPVPNQSNKDLVGSIYVKSSGSANIARFFVNGNSGFDRQILDVTLTNEWQRVVLPVFNTTLTNAYIHVKPGDVDGSIKSLYIWGAQLEESSTTATDYIPTGATISGAPRFDHDPVTGESLGLLIEESRTNLLGNSLYVSFSNSADPNSWSFGISAPDGSNDARKCTTNNRAFIDYAGIGNANLLSTYSVYLRGDSTLTRTLKALRRSSGETLASKSITITEQWQRFDISFTSTTDGVRIEIEGGILGIEAWGAQLEAGGSFPTSYIPTTGSSVTRSPDIATIEGTNFTGGWYDQSEGTIFSDASGLDASSERVYVFSNGTNSRRIGHTVQESDNFNLFFRFGSGASTVSLASNISGLPKPIKAGLAYKSGSSSGAINGLLTASSASTSVPDNIDQFSLGSQNITSDGYLNGHISRLAYFPTRKTDQELIDLTKS